MTDPRTLASIEPHRKPIVQISVDGISLDGILSQRLIGLTHTDNRGFEADTVDLELDDSDGALDLPAKGAVLSVAFGWAVSGLVSKGTFTVDEVGHTGTPDVLSIRAKSADLRTGLTTQRERSWHATTLGAIVQTIASENDLVPTIPAALAGMAIDHLDQTNESAVNLLSRLAQQFDAIATVKDGRLLFIPAGGGVTASGKRIPAVTITRKSGDRHQFSLADRQTYAAVKAQYYDVAAGTKGTVTWGDKEDSAERGIPAKAASATPSIGQHKTLGKTYPTRDKAHRAAVKEWKALKANKAAQAAWVGVKAKYDDRNLHVSGEVTYGKADDEKRIQSAAKTAKKDAEKLTGKAPEPVNAFERSADNVKILRHVYSSKTNANRAARAEWRRLQRGMATFNITLAIGIPELFPETPATVSGWKPQIDSTDWIIIKVTNNIGDAGYVQRLDFEIKATEIPD